MNKIKLSLIVFVTLFFFLLITFTAKSKDNTICIMRDSVKLVFIDGKATIQAESCISGRSHTWNVPRGKTV